MRESWFSNKLCWFQFLLCLLVIWIHAVNAADTAAALTQMAAAQGASLNVRLQDWISNGLAQMAVPGFFMISGYLFYRTLRSFAEIGRKWKSRIFTMLIPYCAWNLIYYLLHVLMGDAPLQPEVLWRAVVFYQYNPVFWYLYQLILMVLLAPLLYFLLRDQKVAIVTLCAVMILIGFQWDLPQLNEDALFYYMLGAAAACHWRLLTEEEHPGLGILFLGCVLAAAELKYGGKTAGWIVMWTVLQRALMVCCAWFLLYGTWLPLAPLWARQTFFVYALHYMIVRGIAALAPAGFTESEYGGLLFLIMPVLCIAFAHCSAQILKKKIPFLWKILTGNRR